MREVGDFLIWLRVYSNQESSKFGVYQVFNFIYDYVIVVDYCYWRTDDDCDVIKVCWSSSTFAVCAVSGRVNSLWRSCTGRPVPGSLKSVSTTLSDLLTVSSDFWTSRSVPLVLSSESTAVLCAAALVEADASVSWQYKYSGRSTLDEF